MCLRTGRAAALSPRRVSGPRLRRCPLPGRRRAPPAAAAAAAGGAKPPKQQQQQQQQPSPQPPPPPQQQQPQPQQPQYLFEPKYGLPVVRARLGYGELLAAIRSGSVEELLFLQRTGQQGLEGPCIVRLRGGRAAQAFVPPGDFRVAYAMEAHGVRGGRLAPAPSAAQLSPPRPMAAAAASFLTDVLPYLAVAAVYGAVRLVAARRGDAGDRDNIKRKAAAAAARTAAEERADRAMADAEILAGQGWTAAAILKKMASAGVALDEGAVAAAVARAQEPAADGGGAPGAFNSAEAAAAQLADEAAFRERMREAQAEADPNARAEEFRKMKTVRVQRAADPARARAVRAAQRGLRGVKLQYTGADEVVLFDDVAGIGDAKVELQEVVDFFTKPERYAASGSRIPRGVLLCGPPGTGKTLLARAVAGEAGVAFLSLNASEFVEMFVGVGASRVRDLFATARSMAPAIVFIDEIDAVGRVRGGAMGNDERDQTLNQMLSEMDGFEAGSRVVVLAATNRRDILDPALVRPGRFDRAVTVALPDYAGRIEILQVHLARRPHSDDIDLAELAFETARFSGAQLANLVNQAAAAAGAAGRAEVANADLLAALEAERLGPPRAPYSDAARRRLAVVEGATALACTLLPAIEPVVAVTVTPREKHPLGQTVVKANEGRELTQVYTRRYLEEQLTTVLAGRAAEEATYGADGMSTLQQRRLVLARRIAQKLVVSAAMRPGDALGPRALAAPRRGAGDRAVAQLVSRFTPPALQQAATEQVAAVLAGAYERARALVARNRAALDAVADALFERGTLGGDELRALVEAHACEEDLRRRRDEAAEFL